MLYTAFLLGLVGSFHCIGMCGPIAFALPLDRSSKGKMLFQTFLYHLVRLITYSLIGVLFGLIGRGLFLSGIQQRLSILMGIIMIATVVIPVKVFNRFHITQPLYKLIAQIKKQLGLYLNKKSNKSIFLIGFFNGFLPCGLVYMALMGAIASSNTFLGASYMFLFGMGTIPMMTLAVYAGNVLKVSLRNKIQKAIPAFVVIIGLLFILRGMGLGIPYLSPPDTKLTISNVGKNCVTPK